MENHMPNHWRELKPANLIISDVKWKYLVRSIVKGKNTIILGPTRSGKTKAVYSAVKALNKTDKFFAINIGSTQDARATLIGNTTFSKEVGTVFHPSEFVKAIQIPHAVILLDELSRGHIDAWNILMPVLDETQRFLRLDESPDSKVVRVANGVTFIATTNIGNEYTATKKIDKAMFSRFPIMVEMDILTKEQELRLLKLLYADFTINFGMYETLCDIADYTRNEFIKPNPKLSTFIPTGSVIEMAELVNDSFDLEEIAECMIYPLYEDDCSNGSSQRAYIKQYVQKNIPL